MFCIPIPMWAKSFGWPDEGRDYCRDESRVPSALDAAYPPEMDISVLCYELQELFPSEFRLVDYA
jgi:hypothetical protein